MLTCLVIPVQDKGMDDGGNIALMPQFVAMPEDELAKLYTNH